MPTGARRTAPPLSPSPAAVDDAAEILHLRSRLVDWMLDRGISQWRHGDVSADRIQRQARDGQWWLVRSEGGALTAAVRILTEDTLTWGPSPRSAVYVHGLMVDRCWAGQNLGSRLLDWAAKHGRSHGAEVLRLDCVATNRDLCSYYLRQGFTSVGTKIMSPRWGAVALFERPI